MIRTYILYNDWSKNFSVVDRETIVLPEVLDRSPPISLSYVDLSL